jgi:hypothetical protein
MKEVEPMCLFLRNANKTLLVDNMSRAQKLSWSSKLMDHLTRRTFDLLSAALLLMAQVTASGATGLETWNIRNPSPTGESLRAVTSGNGVHVAVGSTGTIATSKDGVSWTVGHIPLSEMLLAVTFGMENFVAVSLQGNVWQSSNGLDWKVVFSRPRVPMQGIGFGNSAFVLFAGNEIVTSMDSTNWVTYPQSVADDSLTCLGFEGGWFFAHGFAQTDLFVSRDGTNWTTRPLPGSSTPTAVAFGKERFVAIDHSTIFTSSDAFATAPVLTNLPASFYDVTYGNSNFVAVGFDLNTPNEAVAFTSADGLRWSKGNLAGTDWPYSIEFGTDGFVAVGDAGRVVTSKDGQDWVERSNGIRKELYGGVYGQGRFVVVGEGGTIMSSTTGTDWALIDSPVTDSLGDVAFGGGTWVAIGGQGTVVTSLDGKAWKAQSLGVAVSLRAITYGPGMFVIVGSVGSSSEVGGAIWSSPDGVVWERRQISQFTFPGYPIYTFRDVVYAREQQAFVAVGYGSVATSFDGISWQEIDRITTGDSITYGDGLMVIADGIIKTAVAGNHWMPVSVSADCTEVSYFNGEFLALGQIYGDNRVALFRSSDATIWTEVRGASATELVRIVPGNDSVLLLGRKGTILQSGSSTFTLQMAMPRVAQNVFSSQISLQSEKSFRVEASSNLMDWVDIGTGDPLHKASVFKDPLPANAPRRFYRAVSP